MNKKTQYAINLAAIGAGGAALLNAIKQWSQMNEDTTKSFGWNEFFIESGKGALIGGAVGLAIGTIIDYQNSQESPINTDAILFSIIGSVKLDKTSDEYLRLDKKANRLISILNLEIGHLLAKDPIRLGSTEKGTAIAGKFDIDIGLAFKPKSFSSTEKMLLCISDLLQKHSDTESIKSIRDQKHSIGVIFKDAYGEFKIDIVPCKLTGKRKNDTSGYLFVNDCFNSTYTKTDLFALKNVRFTKNQEKIILLLKHWKYKNNLPLSSHLLENLVKDAYAYNSIPKSFTKKVIMVMKHIRDNLDHKTLKSIENTNNILTDISDSRKLDIINACNKAIEEYEYQPNSVIEIFE